MLGDFDVDEDSGVPVSEQLKQARYPSPHCSLTAALILALALTLTPASPLPLALALAQAGARQELGPRDRPLPGVGLRRRRRDHQEGVPRRDGPHGPRPAPEGNPNPPPTPILICTRILALALALTLVLPSFTLTFTLPLPPTLALPLPLPLALPPKDIDGLFDSWDPSGGGTIDFKELQKVLRGSGGGGSAPGASIKKAVNTQKAASALQGKAKRK